MTPDQFAALAQLLRMRGGAAQEVARLALVEGVPAREGAQRTGMDERQAYGAVQRARAGLDLARRAVG